MASVEWHLQEAAHHVSQGDLSRACEAMALALEETERREDTRAEEHMALVCDERDDAIDERDDALKLLQASERELGEANKRIRELEEEITKLRGTK